MPTLNLPAPYPYVDGTELDVDGTNALWWDPSTPTDSLAIINGFLDEDNLWVGGFVVTHEYAQRGSTVELFGAAGTANLDWRACWFNDYDYAYSPDPEDPSQYIPGGNVSFYAKWPCLALVSWTIHWQNDNLAASASSSILFFANGVYIPSLRREVGYIGPITNPQGYVKGRFWSGHVALPRPRGWHNVGLKVLSDHDIRQTRTYAVSIRVMPIKLS